jgi:hypothetical protein
VSALQMPAGLRNATSTNMFTDDGSVTGHGGSCAAPARGRAGCGG